MRVGWTRAAQFARSLETGCLEKTGREGYAESLTGLQGRTGGKGIVIHYFLLFVGTEAWGRRRMMVGKDPSSGAALSNSADAWTVTEMLLSRIRRGDNSLTGTC